jgi:hypothetical protein
MCLNPYSAYEPVIWEMLLGEGQSVSTTIQARPMISLSKELLDFTDITSAYYSPQLWFTPRRWKVISVALQGQD